MISFAEEKGVEIRGDEKAKAVKAWAVINP